MDWFRPAAVILQCGADSLAGDKLGCFNLSMRGHANCVEFVRSFGVPMMCVGGGGYTIRNVARTWTYETGLLLGKKLAADLPFNEYIQYFGPEYKLDVLPTSMDNLNTPEYLEGLRTRIIDNLRSMPFAPSVQMQHTPRASPFAGDDGALSEDEDSDLDERITQRLRDRHTQAFGDELSDDEDEPNVVAAYEADMAMMQAARPLPTPWAPMPMPMPMSGAPPPAMLPFPHA